MDYEVEEEGYVFNASYLNWQTGLLYLGGFIFLLLVKAMPIALESQRILSSPQIYAVTACLATGFFLCRDQVFIDLKSREVRRIFGIWPIYKTRTITFDRVIQLAIKQEGRFTRLYLATYDDQDHLAAIQLLVPWGKDIFRLASNVARAMDKPWAEVDRSWNE